MNTTLKSFSLLLISSLFFSTTIAQLGPALTWQRCYGGSRNDIASDILLLPDGGYIMAGSSYSNDGDVSGHHGSLDSSDAWVVRIAANGSILWQRSIGGSGNDRFSSIVRGVDDTIYCVGYTESKNGDVPGNRGGADGWVVKMTTHGALIWSKSFGGSSTDSFSDGAPIDGGLALIGTTFSNNGDVTGYLGGMSDSWVIKINSAGEKVWAKCYGGQFTDVGSDIILGSDGKLWAITHQMLQSTTSTGVVISLDHSDGTIISASEASGRLSEKGTIVENNGNIIRAMSFSPAYPACADPVGTVSTMIGKNTFALGTPYRCQNPEMIFHSYFAMAHGIDIISDNYILAGGTLKDLGGGPTGSYGQNDAFLGVLSSASKGSAYYFKNYGGSANDGFNSVKTLRSGNDFVAAGATSSNDHDVSGNHGGTDAWLVLFEGANSISGKVFIDHNKNGLQDVGEADFNEALITTAKTGLSLSTKPFNGAYQNDVDTGSFITSVKVLNPYYLSGRTSKTSSFSTFKNKDTANFPIIPIVGKRDYAITPYVQLNARPGFENFVTISYRNSGTDTMLNTQIRFIKPSKTSFESTVPPALLSGDTAKWIISNMLPSQEASISIKLKVNPPPSVNINDTLLYHFYIDSIGDVNTSNNRALVRQIVRGSYDPNDKQENHGGIITSEEYLRGEDFTYRIRFQNTGNDTAFNISIRDTLSPKLEPETIQMVDASHAYKLRVENSNIAIWDFENIKLVDSSTNEPGSNGFIAFRIRPKNNLQIGDTVTNKAAIYFDFNPPIQTNSSLTVLLPAAPQMPAYTNLNSRYCGNQGQQKIKITNLPLQGSGITTTAKLDNGNLQIASDSTVTINMDLLVPGDHQFLVSYSNITATQTSTSVFKVDKVDTPDVSITSNISNITDLAQQVELTATNVKGGGSDPLFTFSKDLNFNTVLQAESKNNKYLLNPSTLNVGSNWIYVRMKTSSGCFSSQFNIDSIKLERSAITGIIDPDNPGQVIMVYPNPYNDHIILKGLKPTKKYSISLSGLDGKLLFLKDIAGEQTYRIGLPVLPEGQYLLQIKNKGSGQLIGTVKLFRK